MKYNKKYNNAAYQIYIYSIVYIYIYMCVCVCRCVCRVCIVCATNTHFKLCIFSILTIYWFTGGGQYNGATEVFLVDASNGEVKIKSGSDADADTKTYYEFIVEVTDSIHTVSCIVTVAVTDENDNSPVFGQATYAGVISENDNLLSVVSTVAATDADITSTFSTIQFTLSDTYFDVGLYSGDVFLKAAVDFESGISLHTVIVTASDGTNSITVNMVITITDVNDNPPACTSPLHYELDEDHTLTEVISGGDMACTDVDTTLGEQFSFATAVSPFTIDAATGISIIVY